MTTVDRGDAAPSAIEGERIVAPVPPSANGKSRRRASRRAGGLTPYALLIPATAILAAIVGWPLLQLIITSFQEYGRAQVFGAPPTWVWFDNYTEVLTDPVFYQVLGRTIAFAAVCVILTMVIGTLIALMMNRLTKAFRILLSVGLLLAWAMPALTATVVWGWMFDTDYGVINHVLVNFIGLEEFFKHPWLIEPLSFFTVATIIIVWGAVPFVAFTLYAGLTQVPDEVIEAAQLDGAGAFSRFRLIVFPYLKPIFLITAILQIIWDMKVFTQIFALQDIGGIRAETNTLGVYIYQVSIAGGEFGIGGALAMIFAIIMMSISVFYIRHLIKEDQVSTSLAIVPDAPAGARGTEPRAGRTGTRRRKIGTVVYSAIAVVLFFIFAFPVYWMVNTSLQPNNDIRGSDIHFWPDNFTLRNYDTVLFDPGRTPFLPAAGTSLVVTVLTVVIALIFAFLASVAVTRFRFRSRRAFIIAILTIQMIPGEAMIVSVFRVIDGWHLLNTIAGLTIVYVAAVLPFTIWTLRGFVNGVPVELEEAAMIDGCSRSGAFWRVTFPLLAPGLVATGVFGFIQAWNEFLMALVLNARPEMMTLPVWLRTFLVANGTTNWAAIMAGSTLMAIPVIVFFLIVQGRMTSGLVSGAVKG